MTEIALTLDSQHPAAVSDILPAAARAGFTAVGLSLAAATTTTAAEFTASGLRCHELAATGFFADDDETIRDAERAAQAAADLGSPWVLGYFPHYGPRSADQVRRVSRILAEAGSALAIEPVAVRKPDRIAEARELIAAAAPGTAAIVVDSWHVAFGHQSNWDDLASLPAEQIAYVQFADHGALGDDLRDETMNRRLWPGLGEINLERFVELVRGRGWDGIVSVEALNAQYRALPVDDYCRQAFESTAAYWS